MKITDYDINTNDLLHKSDTKHQYGNAYPTTNEPLRWELGHTDNAGAHVLTVAASGDQPLFYAGAGAAHIDTFDITYSARIIMDFKASAIKIMDATEYRNVIQDINNLSWAAALPKFKDALAAMPADTADLLQQCTQTRPTIFSAGYTCHDTIPRAFEHHRIRNNVHGRFNFAWTPIDELHCYLDKTYDVINISNILEYLGTADRIRQVIFSLVPFLRPGGKIIANIMVSHPASITRALPVMPNIRTDLLEYSRWFKTLVIHKTR